VTGPAAAVLAVHPAGRWTGIVRRAGGELAGWRLLARGDIPAAYLTGVLHALEALGQPGDRVALMALPAPAALVGHGGSYAAVCRALLLGALLAAPRYGPPLLVGPAGYGSWLLAGYPAELVGVRERAGGGRLKVCRAAWDLAGAALPDGPPTAAAELERLPALAEVTQRPVTDYPGYRAWLTARCQVCGGQSHRHVPDGTDLAQARERFHAEFAQGHVGLHLRGSGRAGCLLLAPPPAPPPQEAHP